MLISSQVFFLKISSDIGSLPDNSPPELDSPKLNYAFRYKTKNLVHFKLLVLYLKSSLELYFFGVVNLGIVNSGGESCGYGVSGYGVSGYGSSGYGSSGYGSSGYGAGGDLELSF